MYSYGYNSGYGYGGYGCCNPCCGGPGIGCGGATIILVLFILLVIVLGSRLIV